MNKQVKPNFPNTYKICGTSRSPATTNMQMKPRITRRNERINMLQMHVCRCDHKNSRNHGEHETATCLSFLSLCLSFFWCFLSMLSLSLSLSPQGCLHDAGTLMVIQNESLSGLRTTAFPQDSYNGQMNAYSLAPEKRLPPTKLKKQYYKKNTNSIVAPDFLRPKKLT